MVQVAVSVPVMALQRRWEERPVRRRITPMAGLWALRRAWCLVSGSEVKTALSISTRMSEGQGASMALPIYGLYMQKVYADKTLGYSQEEDFDIPEQYQDPCKMTTEEERKQTPTDVGGIDKMFE